MTRVDAALERILLAVAKQRASVVTAVALLCYPGLALVLPLALGWPAVWLVYANVLGASLAALFLLTWLDLQLRAANRRHLVDWSSDLRLLDAAEFEWFVGELFRREGGPLKRLAGKTRRTATSDRDCPPRPASS